MAEFLTTKGIAAQIEGIIKKATKYLYIVTPYLKLSESFNDRLSDVPESVEVHMVYGKSELAPREVNLLNDLNLNIYFKENLHGKCYLNQDYALITSMNLHAYSEANNREFGVLLSRSKDREAFEDCLHELKSVVSKAERLKIVNKEKTGAAAPGENYASDDFKIAWFNHLKDKFPSVRYYSDDKQPIRANDFPSRMYDFSTQYGFACFTIKDNSEKCKVLKQEEYDVLDRLLKNYRFYWNSNDRMQIYHAKDAQFQNLKDDISYCSTALDIIIRELIRMRTKSA